MGDEDDEEKAIRSAALQTAQTVFLARQRVERDLEEAREALERASRELREQREWFRVTLSSIGDAVITTDTAAKVTFLNPIAAALCGWKLEETIGRPVEEVIAIIHEESRAAASVPIAKALRDGVIGGLANQTTLVSKDGREIPIEDSAAPIRDSAGTVIGAVMVFHDVTERRRVERALRRTEGRLNLAMEAGQMGAWEWIVATGKVTWSPTLEALHGLSSGAFGGSFEDFQRTIHPEDLDRVLAKIRESVEMRDEYRIEYRIIKPDGSLCWIEARGKLFLDRRGKAERMAGICLDVTARRKIEADLRNSEEFNRTIVESSRDCTKTLSLDGALLWMSEASQKILCIANLCEVIGKPWVDFWTGEDRTAAIEAVRNAAAGRTGNLVGWHSVRGEPRCWDVVVTPILDRAGRPEKLLTVSRDVTERRTLEEIHARLAAVVEFSEDAIVSKTLEGIVATWNAGAERIFGYAAKEIVGQSVTILIPENADAEEARILGRIAKGEVVESYEAIRRRKDGTLLDVSLTVSPIKNAAGAIVGASKIARDITLRKQAEAERARLSSVLEKSLNEIYVFDSGTLRFQYVNQGALRNLGYTMEEMRRMTPLDIEPELTEAKFREMAAPLLRSEQEKLVFEASHRRADGSSYPVEIHLQSVSSGSERVFMGVVLDITERKRAQEERERLLALEQAARAKAEKAETRARFLAEASGRLSSTLDYEATLKNVVEAAVPQIADLSALHLRERSGAARIVAIAHANPEKFAMLARLERDQPVQPASPIGIASVLRTGLSEVHADFSDEFLRGLARDEEHVAILRSLGMRSVMIVPLVANGVTLGALTLGTAGSDRKFTEADLPFAEDLAARAAAAAENARLYQELRHANAAKDHFIAVLSHELRTPLNPVLMTVTDLERDESVPPAIREQLTVVRRNVELEARLIDDLLDSTRISRGKLQLHRAVVNATELIRRAVGIVEGEAREKGVQLEVETLAEHCPVDADPARLQQVVWNLVKNAVKFTPPRGWVRVRSEIDPPGRLRVTVEDSGIGIDPENLGKIFNAFEQGDAGTGRQFGGLGLGLAISKALVGLHGGSLTAHSEGRGCGAAFSIELPLAPQPPATAVTHTAPSPTRRTLRILVVEDHEATSKVMVRLLTKRGYAVSAASTVAEGLQALEQTPVDLLVTDLGLPDGSGRTLMEKACQTRKIPGIALSGYGTEADLVESNKVGFRVHLTKPIDIDRLDREIQALAAEAETDQG